MRREGPREPAEAAAAHALRAESGAAVDSRLDAGAPPRKLLRAEELPHPPRPVPEEAPREAQALRVGADGSAAPGEGVWQFSPGISA